MFWSPLQVPKKGLRGSCVTEKGSAQLNIQEQHIKEKSSISRNVRAMIKLLWIALWMQTVVAQSLPYEYCSFFRLQDKNMDILEEEVLARTSTTSPKSGIWMTRSDVATLTSSLNECLDDFESLANDVQGKVLYVTPMRDALMLCHDFVLEVPTSLVDFVLFNQTNLGASNFTSWFTKTPPKSPPKSPKSFKPPKSQAQNRTHKTAKSGESGYNILERSIFNSSGFDAFMAVSGNQSLLTLGMSSFLNLYGIASSTQVLQNTNIANISPFGMSCEVKNGVSRYAKRQRLDRRWFAPSCHPKDVSVIVDATYALYEGPVQSREFKFTVPKKLFRWTTCRDAAKKLMASPAWKQLSYSKPNPNTPTAFCQLINKQMQKSGTRSDFGPDSLFFHFDMTKIENFPFNTGIFNYIVLLGKGATQIGFEVGTNAVSITQTPKYASNVYKFPTPVGKRAVESKREKLLLATVPTVDAAYDIFNQDLPLAWSALMNGKPPKIKFPEVRRPIGNPMYQPHNPSTCLSPQNACMEATLDMQMIAEYSSSVQNDVDLMFVPSSSLNVFQGAAWTWCLISALEPYPDIITSSFAQTLSFSESSDAERVAFGADLSLLKIAATGVSVMIASGDRGAGGMSCNPNALGPYQWVDSQWVTSCGAVQMAAVKKTPTSNKSKLMIIGAQGPTGGAITSAGGFSPFFPTPFWQSTQVEKYIKSQTGKPAFPVQGVTQWFNPNGRGYPDLSMFGQNIPVSQGMQPLSTGGTSASAPAFAGIVATLNTHIRSKPGWEKEKLGWLNPFLYWASEKYPSAFHDIVVGSNRYDGQNVTSDQSDCGVGYSAVKGWDAMTGLGVPNVKVLTKAAEEWVALRRNASNV